MKEYPPLDQLIVTLLALVDVAPGLSQPTRDSLPKMVPDVKPDLTRLSLINTKLQIKLLNEAGFEDARARWAQRIPDRYQLSASAIAPTLSTNTDELSTGTTPLLGVPSSLGPARTSNDEFNKMNDILKNILSDVIAFSSQDKQVKQLEELLAQ